MNWPSSGNPFAAYDLMLALLAGCGGSAQRVALPGTPQTEALVLALQGGGHVIYFRHAVTRPCDNTPPLPGCESERNLNARGRADATAVGEAFRSFTIPVGRVVASPTCRTRETATHAFGHLDEETRALLSPEALRTLLGSSPEAGTNTVLVSYGMPYALATGLPLLAEGEAAIFSPSGESSFELTVQVLPDEWLGLASRAEQLVSELLLPDLQTKPPYNLSVREEEGLGRQLRFSNTIWNRGEGPFELVGTSQPAASVPFVSQRIFKEDGSTRHRRVGAFAFHEEHNHWHFENFSVYELFTVTPMGRLGRRVATSDKVSYCLMNTTRDLDGAQDAPRASYGCSRDAQGISPGWGDTYGSSVSGQELNVTSLPAGLYALRSTTDPRDLLEESIETNNAALTYLLLTSQGVEELGPSLPEAVVSLTPLPDGDL